MLTQRWNQLTNREDQMMVDQCLQTEPTVLFVLIEGRWYSKVQVTVQGARVFNYYFEVLDNEHTNMLHSVSQQCTRRWQAQAQEQLASISQKIGSIDQPE
jgi:hypothetical protein